MTDDVNLPPLPHLPLNDPAAAYKAVYDYAKECATAVIEPYAKRIAELESQLDAIGAGGVTQGQRLIKADRQKRGGEPSGAKWYTQSRKGFVQGPCEDEAQATKFALMRSEAFPDYGPYIAICLAPVFAKPTAPQPTAPAQEPGFEVRERGFLYENGKHTPTLLLAFPIGDWDSRDRLAAMLESAPKFGEEE